MGFVWVTLIGAGNDIDAADRNETKTNISALYAALGKNWPGNVSFPVCAGAGWDMAAPCPVVWDIAVGDSIYQTPTAHPISELQEERDKLDWIRDNLCGVNNVADDSGEDAGDNVGAHIGEDTAEDAGDDAGANVGADTGEDAGDDAGANVGADSGENVSADSGANAGANSGENVGADSGADVNDDFGFFGVHDGVYENADCLTDDAAANSVDQAGNWGANDVVDEAVVLTFDIGCTGHFFTVYLNDH